MFADEAITQDISVRVESEYSPERSCPAQQRWFYIYRIKIENRGSSTVQLLNREWVITDATGHVEHVRGAGVVGNQPVLAPGQAFAYTSGCPLGTPFGSMHGTYEMATDGGERLDVRIPPFALRMQGTMN